MTPEYIKEILEYDPETGILRWKKKINRRVVIGAIAGSISENRVNVMINYVNYKGHILAWVIFYGEWPTFEIDHKDTNGTNNSINNLRRATRSQNSANTKPRKNTLSGAKGVTKAKDKWLARIKVNGKQIRLGLFNTVEEAAAAYTEAAQRHFGEFARTDNERDNNEAQTPELDRLLCQTY